jgi:DNA-directed RNA polymerase subunit beta'
VNDGEVVSSLAERLLGRVAADDILKPGTDEVIIAQGTMIDERMADAIEEAGVVSTRIRSPLTCEAEDGVCAMCYGRDLARGTMVNQGEAVGIIAAQSIGEPGTQLTMRTFHIGGVAQGGQQSFLEASQEGKITFENASLLENEAGEALVVGRNMKIAIVGDDGEERASHKLSYGTKLFVKEGGKVLRGDKLFEWDPYTLPIIAEKAGTAKFVDLVSGIAVRDETDDATGMTQKIVIDWRAAPKGNELKPEIILQDKDGEPVRNDAGNPVTYPMSVDAIFRLKKAKRSKRVMLLRVFHAKARKRKTSPVVCHVLPSFSKPVVRKTTRSSQRSTVMFVMAATIRTSAASRLSHQTRAWKPLNTWFRRASTFLLWKATLSRRAITSWTVTLRRMTSSPSWVSKRWRTT